MDQMPVVIDVGALFFDGACITELEGNRVYNLAADALRDGKPVILELGHTTVLTCGFLNASIGRLHNGEFSEEQLASVTYRNPIDPEKIERIIANAKNYFTKQGCKHHNLEVIMKQGTSSQQSVVRWCPECGAVVIDLDYDGRTHPGRVMKMKFPKSITG